MKQATGLKKKAIHISARALQLTNGLPFKAVYGGIGHILMFHRVLPRSKEMRLWPNAYLEVTPEFVEDVIKYFQKLKYKFPALDELTGTKSPAKPFALFTFDYGYKDNLTFASPLMKKYNVPFAIYITTNFPDRKAILWWDALEKKILNQDKINFSFNGQKYEFTAYTLAEKERLFELLHNQIQTTPATKKTELLKSIFTTEELSEPLHTVLSWDEIKQLANEQLVTIGAHTVSHPRLSQLSNEQAEQEITQSIKLIEQHTGKKIKHFAYPFGDTQSFGQREINILKLNNIQTATTTLSKNITRQSLKYPLTLPRIAVGMSMTEDTFDLIRYGVIPMIRNRGRR